MASRHPQLSWVFVYTREAHPGEAVPAHDSFERKLAHARLLRDEAGITRPILVDDLEGTGHRPYGSLPNMTWVVDRGGIIAYKASWTVAANVESFVQRYLGARRERRPGAQLGPYRSEQLELRNLDRTAFVARLERNGPAAVEQWNRSQARPRPPLG